MRHIAFVLLLAVALACAAHAETAFYVAPDGNDAAAGTLDAPFATLARARDAVRELKLENAGALTEPVRVVLRGGMYCLPDTVVFTPEDSGTAECPVTYAAHPGDTPIISGGRAIGEWQVADSGAWTAQLPYVASGDWNFHQLFVRKNGDTYFTRRYRPQTDLMITAGLTDKPPRDTKSQHTRSQDEFIYREGDLQNWANLQDVQILIFHDWSTSRMRIRELDTGNRIVRFTAYPAYRVGHWYGNDKNPYYAENVKEAFGQPGQFYLDRPSGTLQYMPLEGETPESTLVVAPHVINLLRFDAAPEDGRFVEHIRFEGISFCHAGWEWPEQGYASRQGMIDLPAAVEAKGAANCAFTGCTWAHLGGYSLKLGAGCSDNRVQGCRMFDLAGGGVMIGVTQTDAKPPLLPARNVVANCVISDGGLMHFSAHGVWIGIAEDTHVHHNVVRRFGYSTVSAGWKWDEQPTSCRGNVLEYNHIHDAMMILADGGGIYTLGYQPGTVLRGNHVHHVHRSTIAGRAPNNGFFLDQGSKGFLIADNVIYDTSGDPVRFNQCKEDWHTWEGNALGVAPDDPAFPKEKAAAAGLEGQYAGLDELPVEVTPPPVLGMTPPKAE